VHFAQATDAISREYSSLGHRLGWRFLYTPAQSLTPEFPLFFIGLNPGGSEFCPPQPSVEAGNAYRVEPWAANGQLNPLQVQVCGLFERLAALMPGVERDRLMDRSLAANFCPFRSPSWASLPSRNASVAFSKKLWTHILRESTPGALICLTGLPARYLGEIQQKLGWRPVGEEAFPVGWGSVSCSIRRFVRGSQATVLVRLPHLSRFRIIGRPESEAAVRRVVHVVTERISQP
jgi:hypothetical protein